MSIELIIKKELVIKNPTSFKELKDFGGFRLISKEPKYGIYNFKYKNNIYTFRYLNDDFKLLKSYKGEGLYLIGADAND